MPPSGANMAPAHADLHLAASACGGFPHKERRELLSDLAAAAPGDEGKWFAAAKDAGLLDEALELARRGGCDPRTLARAARDFAVKQPSFALGAGLLALDGFVHAPLHDVAPEDVRACLTHTLAAAATAESAHPAGQTDAVRRRLDELAGRGSGGVRALLRAELDRRGRGPN